MWEGLLMSYEKGFTTEYSKIDTKRVSCKHIFGKVKKKK